MKKSAPVLLLAMAMAMASAAEEAELSEAAPPPSLDESRSLAHFTKVTDGEFVGIKTLSGSFVADPNGNWRLMDAAGKQLAQSAAPQFAVPGIDGDTGRSRRVVTMASASLSTVFPMLFFSTLAGAADADTAQLVTMVTMWTLRGWHSGPTLDQILSPLSSDQSFVGGVMNIAKQILLSSSGPFANVARSSPPAQIAAAGAEALNEIFLALISMVREKPQRRRDDDVAVGAIAAVLSNLAGAAAARELFVPADLAPFLCLLDLRSSKTGTPTVGTGFAALLMGGISNTLPGECRSLLGKPGLNEPNPVCACQTQAFAGLYGLVAKKIQAGICPATCSGGRKGAKRGPDCSLCPANTKVGSEGKYILAAGASFLSDALGQMADATRLNLFQMLEPVQLPQAPARGEGGKHSSNHGHRGQTMPSLPDNLDSILPQGMMPGSPILSYWQGAVINFFKNVYITAYTQGVAPADMAPFLCALDATGQFDRARRTSNTKKGREKGQRPKGTKEPGFNFPDFHDLVEDYNGNSINEIVEFFNFLYDEYPECVIQLAAGALNLGAKAVEEGVCPGACSGDGITGVTNVGPFDRRRLVNGGLDCSLCPDLTGFGGSGKKEGKNKKNKGKARLLTGGAAGASAGASAGLIAVATMGAAYLVVNTALGRHRATAEAPRHGAEREAEVVETGRLLPVVA